MSSSGGSSAPAPEQPAPHTHNWAYSFNDATGVGTRTCSCEASESKQTAWVVVTPAQEEVWIDVPVYVTLEKITVYNGPNSIVYESYSFDEAEYWLNCNPTKLGNYIISHPSVIDHYDRVLSKPAREEVG